VGINVAVCTFKVAVYVTVEYGVFLRIIWNCTNPARRGEEVWGVGVPLPRIKGSGGITAGKILLSETQFGAFWRQTDGFPSL